MLEVGLCFLEVPNVIRCLLLCMLEAVEGRLCLLEVRRRCVVCYPVCWRLWWVPLFAGGVGGVGVVGVGGGGGDTLCATLYTGGRGGELCLLEVLEVRR